MDCSGRDVYSCEILYNWGFLLNWGIFPSRPIAEFLYQYITVTHPEHIGAIIIMIVKKVQYTIVDATDIEYFHVSYIYPISSSFYIYYFYILFLIGIYEFWEWLFILCWNKLWYYENCNLLFNLILYYCKDNEFISTFNYSFFAPKIKNNPKNDITAGIEHKTATVAFPSRE